jgi:histidinol phosphatase-like enzyme (inositol monophosphatase family)
MDIPAAPTARAARFSDPERSDIIATAHALADAARAAILPHFRQPGLAADNKDRAGFDPVTVADRASETAMRSVLAKRRPHDGILGEEQAATPGTSGLIWVLDPIDGTRGFISGTPTWGVLIALCDADGPLFGIIDQPYIGERFVGGFGTARVTGPQGTAPLVTRATTALAGATLFTTFPEVGTATERAGFDALRDRVKLTRYGCDCYAYALVAAGQVDLVVEAGLAPYDVAAPIAVVQAAGGVITDWQGRAAHPGGRIVAAATPDLHAAALAILRAVPDA